MGLRDPRPKLSSVPGTHLPLGQNRVQRTAVLPTAALSLSRPSFSGAPAALAQVGSPQPHGSKIPGSLGGAGESGPGRGGTGGVRGPWGRPPQGGAGVHQGGHLGQAGTAGPGSTGRGAGSCRGLPLFLPCSRPRWAHRTVGLVGLTGVSCPLRPQTCRSPLPSCQALLPAAWSDLHLFPGVSEEPACARSWRRRMAARWPLSSVPFPPPHKPHSGEACASVNGVRLPSTPRSPCCLGAPPPSLEAGSPPCASELSAAGPGPSV